MIANSIVIIHIASVSTQSPTLPALDSKGGDPRIMRGENQWVLKVKTLTVDRT